MFAGSLISVTRIVTLTSALHFRSRSSQINLQVWYAKVMVVDNVPNVPGAKYDKLHGVLKKKFGAYGQVNSLFMVRPPTVLMYDVHCISLPLPDIETKDMLRYTFL